MSVLMDDRPTPASARRRTAARFVLPLILLIGGLIGHVAVSREGERRAHERADARAERVAGALRERVEDYGNVLYGVRGLFAASDHVTAREFHDSHRARGVEERYPGVKVVGYADLIPRRGLARRVRQVRREVRRSGLAYPRFFVNPRPGPRVKRVAPITYMEPQATNEAAFGLDFLSEPHRSAAVERTLATGRPAATAPVRLIQEPARQRGFLVMLGVQNRRGDPVGVACEGFRMGELVDEILPATTRDAELEVYDLGPSAGAPARLAGSEQMYDSNTTWNALRPHGEGRASHQIRFDVMGRHWAVYYAPEHRLVAANQTLLDWFPLLVAIVLAGLAAWMLGSSLHTERRAVALAERM